MQVKTLAIADLKLIVPRRLEDNRGCFSEIYNQAALQQFGLGTRFVQDNLSISTAVGTIRGLHFQRPPQTQAKLIMVMSGRMLDVAVDCRRGSSTFGKHVAIELSARMGNQLFVPRGFAHGFCTLEPNTTVLYKVDAPYTPELDSGLLWNDPDLAIAWPVSEDRAILSERDRRLPRFRDLGDVFVME